ncbi:MAG: hypothetical protein ACXWQQ_05645 [Pseudobdellovibrio sp.]
MQIELNAIAKNYWTDLTSHLSGYFSHADREKMTELAAQKLAARLNKGENPLAAWPEIIRDFVAHQNWGFKTTRIKPVKKLTEDQKNSKTLFKYIWAFVQSMIVLKIAVTFFGLKSADNPNEYNPIWVWIFFGISVGSLGFFAYRNRSDVE